ncbi:hypothetical protein GGR54DRAFT_650947 [Hypoxylon sp. NC1633]|nr:hypothetical protein GGR54DRAFT_650947 [Hypoxylon sp. NC1633]
MLRHKPLPLPPRQQRKVSKDTHHIPTQVGSLEPDKTRFAQYMLDASEDDNFDDDESDSTPSEHQQAMPSLKGFTFRKSPREIVLERRLIKLTQENTNLRQQLKTTVTHENREKDELIAILRSQNQRYDEHINQQNQLVARIANTISTVFKEYQDAFELSKPHTGGGDELQNTESHFSEISDSDY